ncbi:MAG: P-II family nitrogen regulator [Oscillospiraceae bacterium]|jgi:nitrogen regulatory protein PII|nr:P-II family nitrogen regulator [Oscillospiraceae bacterium]
MLNLKLVIVITERNKTKYFSRLFQNLGLHLTLAMLGRGTADQELLEALGVEESEREILFSLASNDKTRAVLREIKQTLGIQCPGTSIVLTVPLQTIGGGAAVKYWIENEAIERTESPMQSEEPFELIIVVANEGYSNLVIEAARVKGGATGGTVAHARGIGLEKAQKFFGISLSDEKEMVFIACRARCRKRIMQAILDDAGPASKARSIVFSLPVSDAVGLWILGDDSDADSEA